MSTENSTAKKIPDDAPVRKFMFERSFDDAACVHRAADRKPVLLKPEQLDALKKESYDAGFTVGKRTGFDEQVANQNAVLAKIDQDLGALLSSVAAMAQEHEEHARRLAVTIAKKILPTFTERNGLQEIEALVNDTVREMAREPRLVIRVHEAELETLTEKIQAIAAQRAFEGKVVILADAAVVAGDCRIEWAEGGVERNTPATMESIEQTLLPT